MHTFKSGSDAISNTAITLTSNWRVLGCAPESIKSPTDLQRESLAWIPAPVPGTVAQALQQAGKWRLDEAVDFDAQDWWYQCTFKVSPAESFRVRRLRFRGLATLADVWLNDELILRSDNMFLEQVVDVSQLLKAQNELTICFHNLHSTMAERRARPRWKTKLVQHQQLRWMRTTLLGRIPGWSPPIAPVGPWREILLESVEMVSISDISLQPSLIGEEGVVDFSCTVTGAVGSLHASLTIGEHQTILQVQQTEASQRLSGQLRITTPPLWWPHTHGDQNLRACRVEIQDSQHSLSVNCGEVGFRHVEIDQDDSGFSISINGVPVFCRGACWTVNDIVSLTGSYGDLERALRLARDAGMNMIRVGGTMVYESEAFYRLCDQLGILVWQDFMFANMDYPIDDEAFAASVAREVEQQLRHWQVHPCMTVYCGNSEVEQQAAMLGMPEESWRSRLFSQIIPDLCRQWHPHIPYVPSTPSGGTLPFHVGTGITHYYGVGAYLRPLADVRRADVRFTPECLGFSNVPDDATLNKLFDGQLPVCHHPLWKSRVPRDTGTGWDFEDVRDHYLKTLFQRDPIELRSFDMPSYLALSRITTGEMMAQVFSEWRSSYSHCGGGLVWFYKDLWSGAGWGILDSTTTPKACYRYLQRVWQPQTLLLTDEGLDGINIHIVNERAEALHGQVELILLRDGRVVVAKAEQIVTVAPRSHITLGSDTLLKGFYDVTYSYRFGPPKHNAVIASLLDVQGKCVAEAVYFPGARKTEAQQNVSLAATASAQTNGDYALTLETDTLLQAVHFDCKGFYASEEYFHLVPGRPKQIVLHKQEDAVKRFKAYVESISLSEPVSVKVNQ